MHWSTTMSTIETSADEPTREEPSDSDDAPTLTVDDVFHLLQDGRRRNVLRCLQGEDGAVRVVDVAERVAAWECDTTVRALPPEERERVYVSLYHSHLPKLDDAGVVEYDESAETVERTPLADRLDPHLPSVDAGDDADDPARSWDGRYLGVSGFCAALLAGVAFDIAPLANVSGVALSAVVLVLFTAVTATKIATT
jgi:hypothetical protein